MIDRKNMRHSVYLKSQIFAGFKVRNNIDSDVKITSGSRLEFSL